MDIYANLNEAFTKAIKSQYSGSDFPIDPSIRPTSNPEHGDFQANFAMNLAKRLGKNPREVAQNVLNAVDLSQYAEKLEIAGPGFINIKLKKEFLSKRLSELSTDERCGIEKIDTPYTVVVDYSSPNVAKEMHVGHIRSTIIGDAITRILTVQGNEVLKRNHVGDWGTQFGMLIEFLIDLGWKAEETHSISDLNQLYKDSKVKFDADSDFNERAKKRVVLLQKGDAETIALWKHLIAESYAHFKIVYTKLGVLLTDDDYFGESFYNPMLQAVTEELIQKGVAVESNGAICLFLEEFKGQDGESVPLILRKSDGGFGYDTTDMAAVRHRIEDLKAKRVIYVTDARQKQHFAMIFAGAKKAGILKDGIRLDHVAFGSILGENGKPFQTRSGETVKLSDLLDEAEKRAKELVEAKSPDLSEKEKNEIAHSVGIGAIKYADLSNDRIKDYVFVWERMLAFDGNTAPYLQNAYVRIMGIQKKAEALNVQSAGKEILIAAQEEHILSVELLKLNDVVKQVADTLEPHRLCTYLYNLASCFHQFYEKCPVLKADDEKVRDSRLALCALTAKTLKTGLNLLGIDVVSRM